MPSKGNNMYKAGEKRWGRICEEMKRFPHEWSIALSRVLGQRKYWINLGILDLVLRVSIVRSFT